MDHNIENILQRNANFYDSFISSGSSMETSKLLSRKTPWTVDIKEITNNEIPPVRAE